MERAFDVVVVGGGLSGLTAAVELARGGRRVALVERRSALGGRASTHLVDGFALNEGAHAVFDGGPGRKILERLGVVLRGRPPSPNGALALIDDVLHALPGGPVSLLSTGLFDLGSKLEVARFLGSLVRRDRTPWTGVPFGRFLDASTVRPRVRAFVAMLARISTYCGDVELLDAADVLAQLQLAFGGGVTYLHGGWRTMVDALEHAAREAGVSFVTGEGATAIAFDDTGVRAVRLADTELQATNVVLAVGPQVAASLAPVPSLVRVAADAIPVRAACLDLGVEKLPFPQRRVAFGVDRPLYYSVHSAFAELAPPGAALVHLAWYLREGDSGDEAIAALDAFFARLQPGARVRVRRALPSMTVHNMRPNKAARADLAVPEISGLYLAGDWVGATGMLADCALSSATAVAQRILAAVGSARAAA